MTEDTSLDESNVLEKTGATEIQERRMSLLEKVREGLRSDKRVFFAGEIIHRDYGAGWLETVDIIVSPVEPIYDPNKLNDFMDSLAPDLPRSARDAARHYDEKSNFELGKLYFDESLGSTRREIKIVTTAIEPEVLVRSGVQIGESHETKEENLNRRTWVRVYPDTSSAQIVADYEKGVAEGTVEPDSKFSYMQHRFSSEELKAIKRAWERAGLKKPRLTRGN